MANSIVVSRKLPPIDVFIIFHRSFRNSLCLPQSVPRCLKSNCVPNRAFFGTLGREGGDILMLPAPCLLMYFFLPCKDWCTWRFISFLVERLVNVPQSKAAPAPLAGFSHGFVRLLGSSSGLGLGTLACDEPLGFGQRIRLSRVRSRAAAVLRPQTKLRQLKSGDFDKIFASTGGTGPSCEAGVHLTPERTPLITARLFLPAPCVSNAHNTSPGHNAVRLWRENTRSHPTILCRPIRLLAHVPVFRVEGSLAAWV